MLEVPEQVLGISHEDARDRTRITYPLRSRSTRLLIVPCLKGPNPPSSRRSQLGNFAKDTLPAGKVTGSRSSGVYLPVPLPRHYPNFVHGPTSVHDRTRRHHRRIQLWEELLRRSSITVRVGPLEDSMIANGKMATVVVNGHITAHGALL